MTENKNENLCPSDEGRREIIADIIYNGHATFTGEQAFQMQITTWDLELQAIPTDNLLECFVNVSRGRILTFSAEPLTTDELIEDWNKNLSVR